MDSTTSDTPPPGQAPAQDGENRPPRIVVLTMKSQLRGRIRREVVTLLDRGYDVLIVGLQAKVDFLQGLDHPRLEVQLLKPESVYTKGVALTRDVLLALSPGKRAQQRG